MKMLNGVNESRNYLFIQSAQRVNGFFFLESLCVPFFDCITALCCCLVGLTFSYDGIKEKDTFRVYHCCVVLAYIGKKDVVSESRNEKCGPRQSKHTQQQRKWHQK